MNTLLITLGIVTLVVGFIAVSFFLLLRKIGENIDSALDNIKL